MMIPTKPPPDKDRPPIRPTQFIRTGRKCRICHGDGFLPANSEPFCDFNRCRCCNGAGDEYEEKD